MLGYCIILIRNVNFKGQKMRLTTKGRYAVTAMLDLAIHSENQAVSLADIAERQSISLSYLEQLFSKLRRSDLVKSTRGPGGGYQLKQAGADISIAQVIDSVNETVDATRCGGMADCHHGDVCLTHHLWSDLSKQIHQFLSGISLADLVARKEVQDIAKQQTKLTDNLLNVTSLESKSSSENLVNNLTKQIVSSRF